MQICKDHWAKMRAAVESRGMGHLVAANSRDAHAHMVGELTGKEEIDDFDPLMAAHNMITSYCLELMGLALFNGETCPLCEVLKDYPPIPEGHKYQSNEEYFIDGPVDATLAEATARGLMP